VVEALESRESAISAGVEESLFVKPRRVLALHDNHSTECDTRNTDKDRLRDGCVAGAL